MSLKIAIAVMSANNSVAERNTNCQKETFVKYIKETSLNNEYKVYFYRAKKEGEVPGIINHEDEGWNDVICDTGDRIIDTFEKTCYAYKEILKDYEFDVMIRCNISCYLNMNALDEVLKDDFDRKLILCNSINSIQSVFFRFNDIYPRGDFYITGRDNIEGALKYSDDYIYSRNGSAALDHVDDVLFGMCLKDYLNKSYYDNLYTVIYSYIPFNSFDDMNKYSLNFRVKTIPKEATCSGFSWDDIEERMDDVKKMRLLHEKFIKANYKGMTINHVVVNDDISKPIVFSDINQRYMTAKEIKIFHRNNHYEEIKK